MASRGFNRKAKRAPTPTSWGKIASWYDELLANPDSYQSQVILPNLKRILGEVKGKKILDLACGQGFFSFEMAKLGANVVGVDISPELIRIAQETNKNLGANVDFKVARANELGFLSGGIFDVAVVVLAAQNIKELDSVFAECRRVLRESGRLILILNHPAFRVPQYADWHFNEKTKVQGRVVDRYLSEAQIEIQAHPGDAPGVKTLSFHRPLQVYFKWLAKNGFVASRLEEWISHKKSELGPRAVAEDRARKEIPLFMCLEVKNLLANSMTKEHAIELLEIYARAWVNRDPDLILTIFTPDAIYFDPAEGNQVGHAGIRAYWKNKVVDSQRDIKFDLLNVWITGATVIAEWRAKFIDRKRNLAIDLIETAIFGVKDGKFSSLREYYTAIKKPL